MHRTSGVGASKLLIRYPGKSIASTTAGVAVGSGNSGNNGIFPYACIAPHGTGGRFHYVRLAGSF